MLEGVSLLVAGFLRLSDNQFLSQGRPQKEPADHNSAETMTRHDEKTSAGRAKMLFRGDTGDRLAEVDEVLI